MRALLLTLGLVLASPANAAGLDGEISVELGTLRNTDPAFDLFSNKDAMPSRGVRAGIGLTDHLTVIGGWHRVRRGATLYLSDTTVRTAYFADTFTLGPKAHLPIKDIVYPYVTTQAMLFRGIMKFDDDPDTRHNPGQVTEAALSPGVLGMGGVELRTPSPRGDLALAIFLEAGYGWVARATYGEIGTMKPGGFALRSGFGVRF